MSKFEHVLDDESIGMTHVYFASVQVSFFLCPILTFVEFAFYLLYYKFPFQSFLGQQFVVISYYFPSSPSIVAKQIYSPTIQPQHATLQQSNITSENSPVVQMQFGKGWLPLPC